MQRMWCRHWITQETTENLTNDLCFIQNRNWRYNVRKGYCLLNSIPPGIFLKSEFLQKNCSAKMTRQFPNLKESIGGRPAGKLWICRYCSTVWRPLGPLRQLECDDKPHLQKNAEKYQESKRNTGFLQKKAPKGAGSKSADQP